jgi:lipopolysaccharide biosynthesis glycosyltransferase
MKNGIVLATNDEYFLGLVATINSLRISNPKVDVCVFDTGISEENLNKLKEKNIRVIDLKFVNELLSGKVRFWQGGFMKDFSCFAQLFSWMSGFENILSLEVDTLVLSDLTEYFEKLETNEFVGSMDDGVSSLLEPKWVWPFRNQITFDGGERHEYLTKLRTLTLVKDEKINHSRMDVIVNELRLENVDDYLSVNGGVFAAKSELFKRMSDSFDELISYGHSFEFLAQSYINLFLVKNKIKFYNMGPQWNLSGVNDLGGYFGDCELSDTTFLNLTDVSPLTGNRPSKVSIEDKQIFINDDKTHIVHFTGHNKPWKLPKELNKIVNLWHTYYNDGVII